MIFMPVNEYGFCVNIRDPRIRTRYEEYKTKNNIPLHFPCSDQQRLDFEKKIKEEFFEKYPEHYERIKDYIQDEGTKK
jgi:hypothetical protein